MGNDATVRFSRLGFEDARLFLAGAPLGLSFFLFFVLPSSLFRFGYSKFLLDHPLLFHSLAQFLFLLFS